MQAPKQILVPPPQPTTQQHQTLNLADKKLAELEAQIQDMLER